jgi:hypothetical protein
MSPAELGAKKPADEDQQQFTRPTGLIRMADAIAVSFHLLQNRTAQYHKAKNFSNLLSL